VNVPQPRIYSDHYHVTIISLLDRLINVVEAQTQSIQELSRAIAGSAAKANGRKVN
jgi:hypothetical protein